MKSPQERYKALFLSLAQHYLVSLEHRRQLALDCLDFALGELGADEAQAELARLAKEAPS
jgi:hypothetical protein